ncbi:MAG: class I SAM-dependent methyltransferase [bacterium]|nr:class I SAM-dependent methyltransferase [bacterium]
MTQLEQRGLHEIEHGKKLIESGNPELIWNWDTPAGRIRAQRRGQLLTKAAGLKPGMKVMEVGCGTGLFTEMMAKSGAHILAVDISPDLLDLARERGLPIDQVEFREMRFEDGAADGPFDAIVGSSVLHHLEMKTALRRMYELLKPGGVIAFAEPNMLNPQVWAERNIAAVRERNGASPDETAIVRWRLARDLRDLGFTEIHIRNTDWLHPATPESLIPVVWQVGLVLEGLPLIQEFTGSVLIRARKPF